MNKLEDKLKNIRLRELGEDDKNSIWHAIFLRHMNEVKEIRFAAIKISNLHFRKILLSVFTLLLVFTGAGAGILKASDKAIPGNALFSLGLAVEKLQIGVASPMKKDMLRLKFAEERVEQIKKVSEARGTTILVLNEDKEFLSKINTIEFSKEENSDVEEALNNLTKLLKDTNDMGNAEMIEKALQELLVLLGDDANLVIKRINGVIQISTETKGVTIIETKEDDKLPEENTLETVKTEESSSVDDPTVDEEDPIMNTELKSELTLPNTKTGEVVEEIFCEGEWRTAEDCASTDIRDSNIEAKQVEEIEIEAEHSLAETEAQVIIDDNTQ